jgi:hypothetical protein
MTIGVSLRVKMLLSVTLSSRGILKRWAVHQKQQTLSSKFPFSVVLPW